MFILLGVQIDDVEKSALLQKIKALISKNKKLISKNKVLKLLLNSEKKKKEKNNFSI